MGETSTDGTSQTEGNGCLELKAAQKIIAQLNQENAVLRERCNNLQGIIFNVV